MFSRMICSTPKPGRTGAEKPKNCYVGNSAELMTTQACLERAKEKESLKKAPKSRTKTEPVSKTRRPPKAPRKKQKEVSFLS